MAQLRCVELQEIYNPTHSKSYFYIVAYLNLKVNRSFSNHMQKIFLRIYEKKMFIILF